MPPRRSRARSTTAPPASAARPASPPSCFKQTTGTDIVHVPFRGLPESQTAVIRGDVAMAFTFFNVGGDLVQSGKMRGLAVTGAKRLAGLPDVPTFKEAGVPEFQYDAWFGILAPAGTPKAIVDKASQDIAQVLQLRPTSRRASSRRASSSCPPRPTSSTR